MRRLSHPDCRPLIALVETRVRLTVGCQVLASVPRIIRRYCLALGLASLAVASAFNAEAMTIHTVVGSGPIGSGFGAFGGDGGPATSARLAEPGHVAFDASGNLYIADANNRIRRVVPGPDGIITGTLDEIISTVVGTGSFTFGGDGGPATAADIALPIGLAFDASGNLFIGDRYNHRIRKIVRGADGVISGAPDEIITTVAGGVGTSLGCGNGGSGGDGGPATGAQLNCPAGIAFDALGNLFIADTFNHVIRRIAASADGSVTGAADEIITTVVGTGVASSGGVGGPATAAGLNQPVALAFDKAGNLFIVDNSNSRILRVAAGADGIITGAADEILSVVVGTSVLDFGGDGGPATAASLAEPFSIAFDAAGNLYIADYLNNRIRRVAAGADGLITGSLDEIITTIAGTGSMGFSGDGGLATSAQLQLPTGVAFDASGNLFITDGGNHRVRVVLAAGSPCEQELAEAEQQIEDLQSQLTQLTTALGDGLTSVQNDFRVVFNNPNFVIPGATPLEQYQNLINAILNLNKGRKEGLYVNLGGK